jgi:hypothetical protein
MVESPERRYLHQFESVEPDDPVLNQSVITLSAPAANNMQLRTILLSDLLSGVRSQISALFDFLQRLETELADKQEAGNYIPQETLVEAITALEAAINSKQPAGNYQSSGDYVLQQTLGNAIATLQEAINQRQPTLTISDAGLALIAADSPAQKRLIGYGFHYYQQALPINPKAGERWGELDSKGILIDEWVFTEEQRWVSPRSLSTASPQANISTYPTSVFFGYVGIKYDILVERISLNYNQASGFVAGTTYCSAKFQLTGIQLDQTNTTIPGNYREIGIINQASATGSTGLDVNKIFATDALHYAIGVSVSKVGTGSTSIFYSNFGIQYRLVKKIL